MPIAGIRVEADGVYLCDYGMPMSLFGLLVARFVSYFGSVQIEDFES